MHTKKSARKKNNERSYRDMSLAISIKRKKERKKAQEHKTNKLPNAKYIQRHPFLLVFLPVFSTGPLLLFHSVLLLGSSIWPVQETWIWVKMIRHFLLCVWNGVDRWEGDGGWGRGWADMNVGYCWQP